jgi:hypothetical protein
MYKDTAIEMTTVFGDGSGRRTDEGSVLGPGGDLLRGN